MARAPAMGAVHVKGTVPADVTSSGLWVSILMVVAGCSHAVFQESLQHAVGMPLLMTAIEFAMCTMLSGTWMLFLGRKTPTPPRWQLFKCAMCVLASIVSGNVALKWVSYPVKVVAKSCKLLPTMTLGKFLLQKRYSRLDQLAAVLLCAGLVGFTLSERASKGGKDAGKGSSPLGIALLLFAVCCDAVQVLLSERMLRSHPYMTPMHVNMYTNAFAFLGVFGALFGSGELSRVSADMPWHILAGSGVLSWVGVCCFIQLTRTQSGTGAVVATNVRKLVTIVLSFLIFPKPFHVGFVLSSGFVVAGCAVRLRAKVSPPVKTA